MPNLGFNPSQGSPSSSYGFSAGAASGSNTSRHVQDENVQPRPSTKRKASEAEGSESRATKKVKKSSRPKLWDNRPECSSDDAAGPLSISQQRRIRAKIAASSTKRETQRAEVIPWQVPEEVEIPKEPVISTTELEVEAVERVSGEQIAAVANNTEVPVPDLSFRKWRNNEEKFKMMAHSTRGGGIDGLIKSRNGNVIRPPNPPVPLVQEPETNTGRGKALSSAQIRKLMQYRNRAPSENKLYKPRYKVSKNFCPGQDPRTLPLNLLNRLWDCEPESVSSSEVAMMKELVRPNAEQIKRRRGRRAARELYAEKVKELAASKARLKRNYAAFAAWRAGRTPAGNAGPSEPYGRGLQPNVPQEHKINVGISGAVEMTLEEMQQEYQRMKALAQAERTSKRKRDDDADEDLAAPKGKRPQRDGSSA